MDILYALLGLELCFFYIYFLLRGAFSEFKLWLTNKDQYYRNQYDFEKRVYFEKKLAGKSKEWLVRELTIQQNYIDKIKQRRQILNGLITIILGLSAIVFTVMMSIFSHFDSWSDEDIFFIIQTNLKVFIIVSAIVFGVWYFCSSYIGESNRKSKIHFLKLMLSNIDSKYTP
ncbi:MAG: hypothetical protein RR614_02335 [Eubacterium sp.]